MKYSVIVVVFKKKIDDPNVEAMRHVWNAIEKMGQQYPQYTGMQSQFLHAIKKNLMQEKDIKRVFIVENLYANEVQDACKNAAEMCNMMYGEEENTKGAVPFNAFEKIHDPIKKKRRWEEVLWFG